MSLPLAIMPKTLAFSIYSIFCFLYNTYCARMWSKTRCHKHSCTTYCARMWSNTSCHKHLCFWRACPKHRYLQRFMPLCTAYCAHSAFLLRKTPAAPGNIPNLHKNYSVISDTRSCLMRGLCRPCQYFRHFMSLNAPCFAHSSLRGSRKRHKGGQT